MISNINFFKKKRRKKANLNNAVRINDSPHTLFHDFHSSKLQNELRLAKPLHYDLQDF